MKGYFHTIKHPGQFTIELPDNNQMACGCARCHKAYPVIAGYIGRIAYPVKWNDFFQTEDHRLTFYCEDCWPIVNGIKEPVPDTILSTQLR